MVDDNLPDNLITMSNALIRAGHGLSLAEKRIVMIAMSKIDSTKPYIQDKIVRTKITAAEYAKEWDVSTDTAYNQLQAASQSLHERKVVFYTPSYKRGEKDLGQTKSVVNWVGQVDYHRGEGWVEIHWWPLLVKHLMGLRYQFTSYQLKQASALRSVYSWRLLELLMRFKDTGWAEYSIEDFAASMDATDKQKEDFAAIRRKIIEPAVRELQEKDGWSISWMTINKGRKVKAIRFEFSRIAPTGKKAG